MATLLSRTQARSETTLEDSIGDSIRLSGAPALSSYKHTLPDAQPSTKPSSRHGTLGQNNTTEADYEDAQQDSENPFDVKMEDYDDSELNGALLRDLQEEEVRDSPDSSMTSMSQISPSKGLPASKLAHESRHLFGPPRLSSRFKAKSSIPARLAHAEYARQCVVAARASRLNPFALHAEEHRLLRSKLCHLHVTVYLNIRNGILRLWVRNPNVSVSIEEAVGCTRDERWINLACFAWEWLVRKGYINHGCVDVPLGVKTTKGRRKESNRETIVIIGAGMAGLSCARQLNTVFQHYPDSAAPRIILLEGRNRIGGRIYSHPLSSSRSSILDEQQRPTAEMGAHIIVGFEQGNPLDSIIRGQLALKYHSLRDLSTLYDVDGSAVDESQDIMVEQLYNDILDRTGSYRTKPQIQKTAEGDKEMIESGRDPSPDDDGFTISQYEEAAASGTIDLLLPTKSKRKGAGHKAPKASNPSEGTTTSTASQINLPAARAAKKMGFALRPSTKPDESFDLDSMAVGKPTQTLGAVMDEGVKQYQKFLDLKPKAMRLLNWHFANLEYANATNIQKLSLREWDQDIGNEFEGEHAQIVGGYQQVPRALWRYPDPLDVHVNKAVSNIHYAADMTRTSKASVVCEDGEVIEADKVVLTTPLGVLKSKSIKFEPALPEWKSGAIERLGFGLLNKVVLVFDKVFWDRDRDMFGLLSEPSYGKGVVQAGYEANRGKFYLFWNCVDTSGLPVLIGLMAGDAAHDAERTADDDIVQEVMSRLRRCFRSTPVPDPLETIVTRWRSDRFARGTYSFVAPAALPGDYDVMAQSVGNLYFAGEATCGTHPATVHGAYLSGLRAASEVLDSIVGPIKTANPLVPSHSRGSKPDFVDLTASKTRSDLTSIAPIPQPPTPAEVQAAEPAIKKRKTDEVLPSGTFTRPAKAPTTTAEAAWETALWNHIYSVLGYPPPKPSKNGINPFLLYQKDHWNEIRDECDLARQAATGKPNAKASRDEVRIRLGEKWRAEPDAGRLKYHEETSRNRKVNDDALKQWEVEAKEWDRRTYEVKDEWIAQGNGFDEWVARWKAGGYQDVKGS